MVFFFHHKSQVGCLVIRFALYGKNRTTNRQNYGGSYVLYPLLSSLFNKGEPGAGPSRFAQTVSPPIGIRTVPISEVNRMTGYTNLLFFLMANVGTIF
jgi:hypothetical protein